jgi:hypothetical protein
MAREILAKGLDDDSFDDDDDEDDNYAVVEVDEKEEWWQRLKKLQGEYGAELAACDLEAKKHILDYDPKQGAATTPDSTMSMTSPSTSTRSVSNPWTERQGLTNDPRSMNTCGLQNGNSNDA